MLSLLKFFYYLDMLPIIATTLGYMKYKKGK